MWFSEVVARLTMQIYVGLSISKLQRTKAFAQYLCAVVSIHQVKTPYIQPTKQVDSYDMFSG
jgi:hypothetical protein